MSSAVAKKVFTPPTDLLVDPIFRWKEFPFQQERLAYLIVFTDTNKEEKDRIVEQMINLFPDQKVVDLSKSDEWLKEFSASSSPYELKLDYMTRPLATKSNTKPTTTILNLSLSTPVGLASLPGGPASLPVGSLKAMGYTGMKKMEEAVMGHTHTIASVRETEIVSELYELFDMIHFVDSKSATSFLSTRYKKGLNHEADMFKGKGIIVDNRDQYYKIYLR